MNRPQWSNTYSLKYEKLKGKKLHKRMAIFFSKTDGNNKPHIQKAQ